ncbi:MAG: T9SS type A sorting domain-containing protein [Bacteroidota bacterium]
MKIFVLSFLLLSTAPAWSQNIVPNPDFALHDACPTNWDQLSKCKYWFNPTHATPDYYNACHDSLPGSPHIVGMPANTLGDQASVTNAYTGIITYSSIDTEWREYIAANIPALIPGRSYKVSLKVSLADKSKFATNAPSVGFYIVPPSVPTGFASDLSLTPQIGYDTGDITDKTNWTTLVDTFVADSAYSLLVIGNFEPDGLTHMTSFSTPFLTPYAYYYIDSVSVERIGTVGTPNIKKQVKATLYPNPFTDNAILDIENFSGSNSTLSIYSAQGALVRKIENIDSPQITILRDGLTRGFYYYQLKTQDNSVVFGRMAIQ